MDNFKPHNQFESLNDVIFKILEDNTNRICQLEEEVDDLKTQIGQLIGENERLRNELNRIGHGSIGSDTCSAEVYVPKVKRKKKAENVAKVKNRRKQTQDENSRMKCNMKKTESKARQSFKNINECMKKYVDMKKIKRNKSGKYICDQCGLTLTRQFLLYRHYYSKHYDKTNEKTMIGESRGQDNPRVKRIVKQKPDECVHDHVNHVFDDNRNSENIAKIDDSMNDLNIDNNDSQAHLQLTGYNFVQFDESTNHDQDSIIPQKNSSIIKLQDQKHLSRVKAKTMNSLKKKIDGRSNNLIYWKPKIDLMRQFLDLSKFERTADKRFICNECGLICWRDYNLYKHYYAKHYNSTNEQTIKKIVRQTEDIIKDERSTQEKSVSNVIEHKRNDLKTKRKVDMMKKIQDKKLNKKLHCKQCLIEFDQEIDLTEHKKTHGKNHKCDQSECNQVFKAKWKLKDHRLKVHGIKADPVNLRLSCDWPGCAKILRNQNALNKHMLFHSGVFKYHCVWPGCDYRTNGAGNIESHLKDHTGEKPFKCGLDGCGKAFKLKASLTLHELNHSGQRPFVCEWPGCEAKYKMKAHLKGHINVVHTNSRPYACTHPGCGWRFNLKDNLIRHEWTHASVKRFPCQHEGCKAGYADVRDLRTHCKRENHVYIDINNL